MKCAILMLLLAVSSDLAAHEGEAHREDPPPIAIPGAAADIPHRLADGSVWMPKAAQHLLGIRTTILSHEDHAAVNLLAEVQARPATAVAVAALEPGRIEAADAWPLPGQAVHAGQILAWLRPTITSKDAARRNAQIADLDQKLVIAEINVERLTLQNAVNDNQVATQNIYYEQAVAERDAMRKSRELLAQSLDDRVPLRAAVAGRLSGVAARSGDVVAAGQVLFQVGDSFRLRLAAVAFDPALGERIQSASAGAIALTYRGQEPLLDGVGWRLLFDPEEARGVAWSPGQLVALAAIVQDSAPLPQEACVSQNGAITVWLHREPERFVPVRLAACRPDPSIAAGERLVTQGAVLLSQLR